jgi:leader peptidase (prepilin peptidase)/N-methyltransferase
MASLLFLCLYGVLSVPFLIQHELETWWLFASATLALLLALLSAIDLRELRLPDGLTLPLTALGLLQSWVNDPASFLWHAESAGGAFALLLAIAYAYERVRGQAGMGLGDAKLLAASGAWLGAEGLPGVLLWASGSALVGILIARWRGETLSASTRVPFGPFLAFGTWLVWVYGPV